MFEALLKLINVNLHRTGGPWLMATLTPLVWIVFRTPEAVAAMRLDDESRGKHPALYAFHSRNNRRGAGGGGRNAVGGSSDLGTANQTCGQMEVACVHDVRAAAEERAH